MFHEAQPASTPLVRPPSLHFQLTHLDYLTLEEADQIVEQFSSPCVVQDRQVMWSGVPREQAQSWADKHGLQTLTTAMGPLMTRGHNLCLKTAKSRPQWTQYIKGASILFARRVTKGRRVVVLCFPPPYVLNPTGLSNYQALEEPILKECTDSANSMHIYMCHPMVVGAEEYAYEVWPVDHTSQWIERFGTIQYKRPDRIQPNIISTVAAGHRQDQWQMPGVFSSTVCPSASDLQTRRAQKNQAEHRCHQACEAPVSDRSETVLSLVQSVERPLPVARVSMSIVLTFLAKCCFALSLIFTQLAVELLSVCPQDSPKIVPTIPITASKKKDSKEILKRCKLQEESDGVGKKTLKPKGRQKRKNDPVPNEKPIARTTGTAAQAETQAIKVTPKVIRAEVRAASAEQTARPAEQKMLFPEISRNRSTKTRMSKSKNLAKGLGKMTRAGQNQPKRASGSQKKKLSGQQPH